ncbi:MAG: energy-coupling factor transporter transmembrane protein EcfT [Tenericutes bacterium]|nr:energy-coupling factor transporter transmembrane protein EcfT [Mycoplasmatota bacterium]
MYSRNSFGSYYPVKSSVHKLNPVIKLICFLIATILLLFTNSLYINLYVFAIVIILILLSNVPIKYYFKTFWSMRYIYIFLAFLLSYLGNTMQETLIYILKLISFVEYLNILAYTTSPSESAYGIEKFLSFFNFMFLPVSKIALKLSNALRYIPLMIIVENKTLKAQASRGIDYYHSNIIGRINATMNIWSNVRKLTKNKNKEIEFENELKLFNIKIYRTNYSTNKVSFFDIFILLFHLVLIYAYITQGVIL